MNCISTRIAAFVLAVLTNAVLGFHGASAQTVPPTGDAARGRADFLNYGCYECHGTLGQGNNGTGPKLAPHPIPYVALSAYVRRPSGQMPSFSAVILSDRDLADIYAYLTSIRAGTAYYQIPLLLGTTTKAK